MELPRTTAEAAALLGQAAAEGRAVRLMGSGSRSDWWPGTQESTPEPLMVSTLSLSAGEDIHGANLTATFPAALPLRCVHERLAASGLWLPLLHLDSRESTLGGCVAAGFVNPLQLGFGVTRDWVLGLEVVTPTGSVLSLGGELVKNVAGYDLVRPHLGAWGRLGLISRVTVRLLPPPLDRATVEMTCAATAENIARVDEDVRRILTGRALPVALEVSLNPGAQIRALAEFTGSSESVSRRAGSLGWDALHRAEDHLRAWQAYAGEREIAAAVLPWRARVGVGVPGIRTVASTVYSTLGDEGWHLSGHAGSGVYYLRWRDEAGPATLLEALAGELPRGSASGAYVVAEGAAAAFMTRSAGWVGFPPRPPRSQDGVETALVRALSGGRCLNQNLPLPEDDGACGAVL